MDELSDGKMKILEIGGGSGANFKVKLEHAKACGPLFSTNLAYPHLLIILTPILPILTYNRRD